MSDVDGRAFTTTVVVPAALVHPLTVTVTLYIPASARTTATVLGFCKKELKLLGPVQLYVAPATSGVVRFKVAPTHKGPLLAAVGVDGIGLTVISMAVELLLHPPDVTVLRYQVVCTNTPGV